MFGFIRNTISALKGHIKTAVTYLLINAVKKDRRWAIKPLIWLSADCNATCETTYSMANKQTNIERKETILSYTILNNKNLAIWLLSIPEIQQQVKNDKNNQAFITSASCIVDEATYSTQISINLGISQKLLELKPIDATIVVSAIEQYDLYNAQTLKYIIDLADEKKVLHKDNNISLNTTIKLAIQSIAKIILSKDTVKEELIKTLPINDNDSEFSNAVDQYLQRLINSKLIPEFIDTSWVADLFREALGRVTVVKPPILTVHNKLVVDKLVVDNQRADLNNKHSVTKNDGSRSSNTHRF